MIRTTSHRTPATVLAAVLACALLVVGCSDDDPAAPADPLSNADFVFVDAVGGAVDGDGTKESPLAHIQAAIALAAAAGKDVCVAEGTYAVDSSAGGTVAMDPAVSLRGGYRNEAGTWTRDPDLHTTTITDLAAAGGTHQEPRAAVTCGYGLQPGPAPVIDGFTIVGGGGDRSAAVFVGEGASVTISNCVVEIGPATDGTGVKNWSSDRDLGTLVTITDCVIGGGGGTQVTGIQVSRGDLTVRRTTIAGLTAVNWIAGMNCGYGHIVIADCLIDGGTASASTRGLYLNQAFTSAVTGCAIDGGRGGIESYGIQAMDTEQVGSIAANLIDGGAGTLSVGFEMGWVEANPAVERNTFRASGGTDRFGIYERDNVSDPVTLAGNVFDASLLAGAGTSVYYRDRTANTTTDVDDIAVLNALDENGLNPAGTVSGNTAAAR